MPGVVDTNILLYAANADAPEHERASRFLSRAGRSNERWYLTEGILYEFFRVATHPAIFPSPLAWQQGLAFLAPLLESPSFVILGAGGRHWAHLAEVLEKLTYPAGNLFFDVRTAVLMREHGSREIYTTDTDFLQFPDLRAIDPVRASGS